MCAYITLPLIKKGKWKNSQGLVFTSLPLFWFALWWFGRGTYRAWNSKKRHLSDLLQVKNVVRKYTQILKLEITLASSSHFK